MKILCITHADFETPGVIADWASNCGYDFEIVTPYKNPQTNLTNKSFDALIWCAWPLWKGLYSVTIPSIFCEFIIAMDNSFKNIVNIIL